MPWRKGNRLRLVSEQQADEATRAIYADIRRTLGLPALQLFYPALGVYPTFLRLHWEAVRPVAASQQLFDAASCLRADAYTRAHNYFELPDLSAHARLPVPDVKTVLGEIVDAYHYLEPLLLLLFCYQMQALEGSAGQPVAATAGSSPQILATLPSASEEDASPALKKRYEEIRRTLDLPFVNPEYCAFARSPEFFDAYWESLKKMMGSPMYDECKYGMRTDAWSLATKLPGPTELSLEQLAEAGMSSDDMASVARILELFVQNLSGQLLNVAAAKIALEGGNLAVPESQTATRRKRKSPAA